MKKLGTNLKKEDIALTKGYMRWYRIIEDELRLFINERHVDKNKEAINKIFWREDRALLCRDNYEYAKGFYDKHKDYNIRFFVKADSGALYSEYSVKDWGLSKEGIEVLLY